LIDLIFKERIEDGQLDDTDLTFRDLRRIKDTFLEMLLGIYHVRVKYPDQEKEEEEAEPMLSVSQAREGDVSDVVSILYERDVWGTPEQSISSDRLRTIPGVRDPRAPRPEVAQASPHHTVEGGDGLRDVEAVEGPPSAETLRREATPRRPTALPGETSGNGSPLDESEGPAADDGTDGGDSSGDTGQDAAPSPDADSPGADSSNRRSPEPSVEDEESPEEARTGRPTNVGSGSENRRSGATEGEENKDDRAGTQETGAEEDADAAEPDEQK
jgi:hypothetical protein